MFQSLSCQLNQASICVLALPELAFIMIKQRHLEGNQFEGPIPESLGGLPQLHELYVSLTDKSQLFNPIRFTVKKNSTEKSLRVFV